MSFRSYMIYNALTVIIQNLKYKKFSSLVDLYATNSLE